MVQNVGNRAVPRSSVRRAMRRREAIALALLVPLGLTSSDAGWHEANAAGKDITHGVKEH